MKNRFQRCRVWENFLNRLLSSRFVIFLVCQPADEGGGLTPKIKWCIAVYSKHYKHLSFWHSYFQQFLYKFLYDIKSPKRREIFTLLAESVRWTKMLCLMRDEQVCYSAFVDKFLYSIYFYCFTIEHYM